MQPVVNGTVVYATERFFTLVNSLLTGSAFPHTEPPHEAALRAEGRGSWLSAERQAGKDRVGAADRGGAVGDAGPAGGQGPAALLLPAPSWPDRGCGSVTLQLLGPDPFE